MKISVKKENRFIILDYILAALFLIGIIYMYEVRRVPSDGSTSIGTRSNVPMPLSLLYARTSAEQELGLGQRASLPADEGMLFVFDTPNYYAFWMKDMSFPIDMIWLDADYRIVYIASNVSPATYPHTFSPPAPSSYVLETNAGYAQKNNLSIGETLNFIKGN
jgi:uncharacterized membrane protein (UPF0127 family)